MTTVESSLEQFPLSSKLEMAHDQATEVVDQVEAEQYTFEPLIAGDFPTMCKPATPKKEKKKKENLDLASESAFPSLSSSGSRSPAVSCWSSPVSRVKSQPTQPIRSNSFVPTAKKSSGTQITDILEISADKQIANLPERPTNFKGNTEIIQEVMGRTGTNIIASTKLSGTSTYLIQGTSGDVARAKRELLANIAIKFMILKKADFYQV